MDGNGARRGTVKGLRRFTLVELLVVVAVISLLMAMLLPALKSARDKANQIKCSGNLKQLGTSFVMYSGDFWECLPPSIDASSRWWCRNEILGPYFGYYKTGGGIMRCPSHPQAPFNHACSNYTMNTRGNLRRLNKITQPSIATLLADCAYPPESGLQFDDATASYLDRVAMARHGAGPNCLFADGHVALVTGFTIGNVINGW